MAMPCITTTATPIEKKTDIGGTVISRHPRDYPGDAAMHNRSNLKPHRLPSRLMRDPGAIRKLQKLLLLLRHASICVQQLDSSSSVSNNCLECHCGSMRNLLRHAMQCSKKTRRGEAATRCRYPHCDRIRFALWHFKNCGDVSSCPVCRPVRDIISYEERHGASGKNLKNEKQEFIDRVGEGRIAVVTKETT